MSAAGAAQCAATDAAVDAAVDALNLGTAAGGVGVREAAAALAAALAHCPGIAARISALGRDLAGAAAGRTVAAPARGDARFTDPAWREHPLYRRLGQAYLALENSVHSAVADADVGWRTAERARFAAAFLTCALAPTNTLAGNPAALKHAFDTGGASLLRGARNLAADAAAGRRTPRQTDAGAFTVGEDLAATPGSVVFRNEVVEIIQYAPTTPRVHRVPLLIVWSLINRYYILDLAPGRSFVQYAVSQGIPVFVTSWRNPGRAHAGWDLDTYASALLSAMDAVADISGSPRIGTMGLCSGGQLLAGVLAYLAAGGDERVAYACFGVSQLDTSVPGVAGLAVSPPLPGLARLASRARGVVDGRDLAAGFAWLRPNELVWTYWVNNYLMGRDPAAFDILAWNADTTRLPGAVARQLLRIAQHNLIATPGGLTLLGTPVDLSKVGVDAYVIGAQSDHLVPWRAAYRTAGLLGGESTFVLCGGGHIQHLVNPPGSPKARYRVGPVAGAGPDAWLAGAAGHEDSWWGHWARWVRERSDTRRRAPAAPGNGVYPPLDAAPGAYVRER